MKNELRNAFGELNGLIFKGLGEDNPDNKMSAAMAILLQLGRIEVMVEKGCTH